MMNIHKFPDELLLRVLSWVPPKDLESFAYTSPSFYRVSYVRLQERKSLRAQYRMVELEDQPDYHLFLSKVLLTGVGFYVEEVHMHEMRGGYGWEERDYEIPDSELDLYRSAMVDSPYIDHEDIPEWMYELESGDEDPVMAVLLPLLPNLLTLTLKASPQGGEMDFLSKVVRRVALATSLDTLESISALQKLRKVNFRAHIDEIGFDLETVANFLALPSVRKVDADYVAAFESSLTTCKDFRRDENLPLSIIDSCTFTHSNISLQSLQSLTATIKEPVKIVVEAEEVIEMPLYEISITRKLSDLPLSAQLKRLTLDQYLIDGL